MTGECYSQSIGVFSCRAVLCLVFGSIVTSCFVINVRFFFFIEREINLILIFLLEMIRGGTRCWSTRWKRRPWSPRNCWMRSSEQITVSIFLFLSCDSVRFLNLIGWIFCRNGIAGKLPSPPLSPLLGHSIENNNNINNNIGANTSAKSSNGPIDGEVRRKVTTSYFSMTGKPRT